jgi:hypothetical protein
MRRRPEALTKALMNATKTKEVRAFMVVSWCLVNAGDEEGHPIETIAIENRSS